MQRAYWAENQIRQATTICAHGSCPQTWLQHQEFTLIKVWEMQGQCMCLPHVLLWEQGTNTMNGDSLKSTWPSVLLGFISWEIPTSCHSRGSSRREQRLLTLFPVYSWHLANSFQTAPGGPGDGRWNQPLWRAVVQKGCGISVGCTTVHTIPCSLPTTTAHLA